MSLLDSSVTSDKDYLKIHDDGLILVDANGVPGADASFPYEAFAATWSGFENVNHGLGTVPLVRAFWDPGKNGRWWASHAFPDFSLGLFPYQEVDPFLLLIANTTNLKLIMGTNIAPVTDIPVFYRIYDLGAKSIDSDSRIDKIFFKEPGGSLTVGAAASSFDPVFFVKPIAHTGGEAPIWTLQFSEDNVNWYNENSKIVGPPDTGSGPPGGPYSRYYYTTAYAYATATDFVIIGENNYGVARNIYYRYTLDYRT